MIKISLLISFFLVINYANAQHNLFIKAGTNISNNTNIKDEQGERAYKPGLQVGVVDQFEFSNKFNLTAEGLFVLKGHKFPNTGESSNLQLYYINFPILVGYTVKRVKFELGPELGYLLFADIDNVYFKEDYLSKLRNFDLSIGGGLNCNITNELQLGLRFVQGIVYTEYNQLSNNGLDVEERKYFNRSYQFSLNFKIN